MCLTHFDYPPSYSPPYFQPGGESALLERVKLLFPLWADCEPGGEAHCRLGVRSCVWLGVTHPTNPDVP